MTRADSAEDPDSGDRPPLSALIEELRRIECRRLEATPGSSEYIEVLGFERTLVERIHERVDALDQAPYWPPPERDAGR